MIATRTRKDEKMNRKQRRPAKVKAKEEPTTGYPIAAPPKAPPGVRELVGKLLTLFEPVRPKDETPKATVELHEEKALALLTCAAFYVSQMPNNEHRRRIIERAVPLLKALVRDNENARRGVGTAEMIRPGATKH